MGTEIQYFHACFKRVPRTEREQILCAMIRINYGTPWDGDLRILQDFFPQEFHRTLVFGGLTELIEALSPFADEPTDYGLNVDEKTEPELEVTDSQRANALLQVGEVTQEINPLLFEVTETVEIVVEQ